MPLYGFWWNTQRWNLLRSSRRLLNGRDANTDCIYNIKTNNSSDSLKRAWQLFTNDILTNNESKHQAAHNLTMHLIGSVLLNCYDMISVGLIKYIIWHNSGTMSGRKKKKKTAGVPVYTTIITGSNGNRPVLFNSLFVNCIPALQILLKQGCHLFTYKEN